MTLSFYFDQHVPGPIARGLQARGIDVIRTQDERAEQWPDERLLGRATELGRVFVTQDPDLIAIANQWLAEGRDFAGLVKLRNPRSVIGPMIEALQRTSATHEPAEMVNRIVYISV